MKRSMTLFLVLVLVVSLLSGCDINVGDIIGNIISSVGGSSTSGTKDVSFKSLFINTDYLKLKDGTFTEEEHYCSFIIEGIASREATRYVDALTAEAQRSGCNFSEQREMYRAVETDDGNTYTNLWYSKTVKTDTIVYLRSAYYAETLMVVIGDQIPGEEECWAEVGMPEDLIPEPLPPYDLFRYIPSCASVTSANNGDLFGTHVTENEQVVELRKMNMDLMNDYVQAALDMGYEEVSRGTYPDTEYQTLNFRGINAEGVAIDIYFCEENTYIAINTAGEYVDPAYGWRRVASWYLDLGDEQVMDLEDYMMSGGWVELIEEHTLPVTFGAALLSGNGMTTESGGFRYWFAVDCTPEDFRSYVSDMEANGFNQEVEESVEGDVYLHTACRICDYNGEAYYLWETICLQGDYFFVSVGYTIMDQEIWPTDPRLE